MFEEKYQKERLHLEEELRNAPEPTRKEHFLQYSAFVSTAITAPISMFYVLALPAVLSFYPKEIETALYETLAFCTATFLSTMAFVKTTVKIEDKIDHKKRLIKQLKELDTKYDMTKRCFIQMQSMAKSCCDKDIEKTLQTMIDKHYEAEEKAKRDREEAIVWRARRDSTTGTAW